MKLRGKPRLKPAAILILALVAWTQGPAGAQAATLATLDEIAAAARTNSLDLARARSAASQAALAVPGLVKLKSSTLSAAYSYAGSASEARATGASPSAASISANVPILDQIGLSAQVDQSLATSVSASLAPLAHSDARTQALLAYRRAAAAAEDAGAAAGAKAVKAALSWIGLKRQLATAERAAAIKRDAYEAAKAGNAIDPASVTVDDLVAAMQAWSDSRTALAQAQSGARNAETALYSALGSSKAEIAVAPLDAAALAQALKLLEARLAPAASGGPAESYALKSSTIDVASAESKLKSTWPLEPDLTITGGFSIPSAGPVAPSASVKLTLSLDDLKGDQIKQAAVALDIARRSLALQRAQDATSYDLAAAAVQAAAINVEARKLALDQAAGLVQAVQLDRKAGSASALDAEIAELSLAQADDAYFLSLADEYSAWLELGSQAGM